MDVEELEKLRKLYNKTYLIDRFNVCIVFLWLFLMVMCSYIELPILVNCLTLFCFITCGLGIFFKKKIIRKYMEGVKKYKETIIPIALKSVMHDPIFEIGYKKIADYVRKNIILHGDITWYGDYIKGKYKSVDVELSELYIAHEAIDNDGHTDTIMHFNGVWFVIDFNKPFKNDLLVYSKNYHYAYDFGKEIETEEVEFNEKFSIRSNNELEAFYILTPSIMEKIKELDSRLKCRLIMFFEDSKLNIGLDGYKNLFEPNVNEEINIDKFKDKILVDLGIVFDLIETLDLDNDLFKK